MKITQASWTFLQNSWRLERLLEVMETNAGSVTPRPADLGAILEAPNWEALFNELKQRTATVRATHDFLNEWYVVMQVTFTETYLHDMLCEVAQVDESYMKNSAQTASYAELHASASLTTVLDDMRSHWARAFIDEGGPAHWIERLSKMGARGYAPDAGHRLEQCWGVRHVVVHRAGEVTADFAKRHPEFGWKKGDRVAITPRAFYPWLDAIKSFVETTDAFFQRRHGDLPVQIELNFSKITPH